MAERFITYGFPLRPSMEGKLDGGLPAAIVGLMETNKAKGRNVKLTAITADFEGANIDDYNLSIVSGGKDILNPDVFKVWFGEQWVMLHPDAHTIKGGYPSEVLQAMFPEEYRNEVGSLERAIEYVDERSFTVGNPSILSGFSQRFDHIFNSIPAGSKISWQDYMWIDAMNRYGTNLRHKDIFQTFHLHTTLPEELYRFRKGQEFLRAMSLMNEVYLHTDQYRRTLEFQLNELGLSIPTIRRFNLGPDEISIKRRLAEVTPSNYMETPEYKNMSREQQEMIDEIIRMQETEGLHRFISIDRADQCKGQTVVLEAIDAYLKTLSEDQIQQHRFVFVLPQLDWPDVEGHPQRHYIQYLKVKLQDMKEKYPSVIHYTQGIPPRLIPLVSRKAHAVTGGIQDGLCLSPQEILTVNSLLKYNTSGIIGLGTGFAIQTLENNRNHELLVRFVHQGEVEDIVLAIQSIVQLEKTQPELLGRQTQQLVDKAIRTREDGVLPKNF